MKNAPRTENLQASLLNFVVNHISSEISETLNFSHRDGEWKMCLFQLENVSTSLQEALGRIWTVAAGGGNRARAGVLLPHNWIFRRW